MSTPRNEDAQVAEALRRLGYDVDSVYDLVNMKSRYKDAIPVLVHYLGLVTDHGVKEGIVRALSVKEARGIAAEPLLSAFKDAGDGDVLLKWAIGNALSIVADESVHGDLVRLVQDRTHGKAREMLTVALGNIKEVPEVVQVLIDLLDDEQVVGHALIALGKLRAHEAKTKIKELLNHEIAWIRKEAQKALKKIDRR
jgi:HEAT repeat protein